MTSMPSIMVNETPNEASNIINMSTMKSDEPRVQDAAMSLCALGRSHSSSPASRGDDAIKSCNDSSSSSRDVFAAHGENGPAEAASVLSSMNLRLDDRLRISDAVPLPPPLSASLSKSTQQKAAPKKARANSAKYNLKPKDPKRDTSVPFDEMKRLMRVYGSLKCLRNRTPVDSGRSAKVDSIKRKFYRWFPDLEERFDRTPEGWFRPRAGHDDEMRYREAMRKSDQDSLVKKRNSRRSSAKLKVPPQAV